MFSALARSAGARLSAAAAGCLLLAGPGMAQSGPEGTAAGQGAPQLNLAYDRFKLSNGLTVIVHEDHKAPVVAISIFYHVGSKNEPAGKAGFAHLFEHLMFNGSENFHGDWFGPMQKVGATDMNGTTSYDRTNYFETVPTPALDLALWMESDRMGHLVGGITQDVLDEQRGVVQNEKRQDDNQPYGRLQYPLFGGLFPPGHPYHHTTIGSMADLNAASLANVKNWFKTYYGPNNAVIALAGDIDVKTAREKVQRYFGDIPPGPAVDVSQSSIPDRDHDTRETQYDEVPAALVDRVWAVPPRTTRDAALLDLAASIIGDGRNSRLYLDLVYNRQVASQVNVGVTPLELSSVFDATVVMNPGESAQIAGDALDHVVAKFLEDGPTADELQRAVTSINASTVRGLEKVGGFRGQATVLAQGQLYAGDPAFIETYLKWVNSATPADVRDAARRWLGKGWHQVDVLPTPKLSAAKTGVDRSKGLPPIPTQLPKLRFPAIQQTTLDNGMRVILAERHSVPLVEFSMQFDAGYAADAGRKLGVAQFAMSMLDQGTQDRSALEISAEADRLGANISANSTLDSSYVHLSALSNRLEPSVDLWADVIRHPAFAQDEIARLRGQTIASIAQEKAEPEQLALRLLPPALYGPNHAYGVPFTGTGTVESVKSITRADLVRFDHDWIRPDNATLFVVGDTTLVQLKPMLERAFADWKAPAEPLPTKNVADVALPKSPRMILIDKPGSPQSLIMAGEVAPGLGTDHDVAIEAMNDVLGGDFTSRINMNLREGKHWAYGAHTFLESAKGPRPFLVYAPVQIDKTGASVAELVKELEDVTDTRPITQQEMANAVAGETRGLPGRFQTNNAVLASLVTSWRYGRPLDYAATLEQRFESLKLDDLESAAHEVVHPESLVWIVVGDLAKIRPQIEKLGIAPIEIWDDNGHPVR